jgi:pimeloyl-ACP methyl ester carboxylesterase
MGHATGFCKEVWRPVVAELRLAGAGNEIVALDFSGHGATPARPDPEDWSGYAAEVAAVLDGLSARAVGVGHSMGATAMVMAELDRPRSFSGLVLIEPVVFPDGGRDQLLERLHRATARRRYRFPDREAAAANFSGKPAFARWHPAALSGYLEGGLVQEDGDVRLACSPSIEADIYPGAKGHRAWYRLGELDLPVLVMASGASAEYPPGFLEQVSDRIPGARAVEVPGTSHFLPMERPDAVAAEVLTLLSAAL